MPISSYGHRHRSVQSHLLALTSLVLCTGLLAGCGKGSHGLTVVGGPPAPSLPATNGSQPPAPGDYHSLAVLGHNMNAAAGDRRYARVHVRPQQAVDFTSLAAEGKAASSLAGLAQLLPAPAQSASAGASTTRHGSVFAPDDLIVNGGDFDPALPLLHTVQATDASIGSFNTNTDPYQPDIHQGAYAIYRFTLNGYAASGQPQSVGTLWDDLSSPNRYFVGLANWQTQRWEWFEGTDNVVTVASLAPYINPADDGMQVAVYVLDNTPRKLLLLQVGALEVRAFGARQPTTPAGQNYTEPDDNFTGKGTSSVPGAPAAFQLDETWVGPVYDQGQIGMCTACAAAAMDNYENSAAYSPYWVVRYPWRTISAKWLYTQTDGGNCGEGRSPDEVLDFMKSTGAATMDVAPFNFNCIVDYDVTEATTRAGFLKATGWTKIHHEGQIGIDDVRYQLFVKHHPVLLAMSLSDNFEDDVSAGKVYKWTGSKPDYDQGHSMLIIGYDDAKSAFRVRNSWGADWGEGGDFWLSYTVFSSKAWVDCFAMWTNYRAATATNFQITADVAIPPYTVDCSTDQTDRIRLDWSPVPLATGYRIYRDSLSNRIKIITDGSTTTYDDLTPDAVAANHDSHTYYIQTVVGSSVSRHYSQGHGWRKVIVIPPPHITLASYLSLGRPGDQAQFGAEVDNPSGDPLSYSWNFPTGSILEASPNTAAGPLVTFNQVGSYSVMLTVTNAGGSDQYAVAFDIAPDPPVASFTGPATSERNKVVYFDGTGSSAGVGRTLTTYCWDWNHDGVTDDRNSIAQFARIFTKAGPNLVGLRVIDDREVASDWLYQNLTVTALWQKPRDLAQGGDYISLANVAGMPAIAYDDSVNGHLKYLRASDVNGGAWSGPSTIDASPSGNYYISLADVGGFPAVAYENNSSQLLYARATDASGSAWGAIVVPDTDDAQYITLRMVNGKPAIAYYDHTQSTLRYVQALDATGATWGTPVTVDGSFFTGLYASLDVINGKPAIGYYENLAQKVFYVAATDADGSAWGTKYTVDSGAFFYYVSLSEVDGNPAVSYVTDGSPPTLDFSRATDAAGTTWPARHDLVALSGTSYGPTTLVGALPAIAFYWPGTTSLWYIQAADVDGASWGAAQLRDGGPGNDCGSWSSMALLPSGVPGIAYYKSTPTAHEVMFVHSQ